MRPSRPARRAAPWVVLGLLLLWPVDVQVFGDLPPPGSDGETEHCGPAVLATVRGWNEEPSHLSGDDPDVECAQSAFARVAVATAIGAIVVLRRREETSADR